MSVVDIVTAKLAYQQFKSSMLFLAFLTSSSSVSVAVAMSSETGIDYRSNKHIEQYYSRSTSA